MDSLNENKCVIWSATDILNKYTIENINTANKDCKDIVDFLIQQFQICYQDSSKDVEDMDVEALVNLQCRICTDLLNNPITLLCGHTYCRDCLLRREQDRFIELCIVCDSDRAKHRKFYFTWRSIVNNLKCDINLEAILQECFQQELCAKKLRIEGNEFYTAGKLVLAEEKYCLAVERCPDSILAWSNLSNLNCRTGYFEKALEYANKAIEISPPWSKGYYRQSIALKGLQKDYDALCSLMKYLILEPQSVIVRNMLLQAFKSLMMGDDGTYCNEKLTQLINDCLEFCLQPHIGFKKQRSASFTEKMVDKMKTELTCALCCRLFFEPTTTPCGHTFCSSCLERSLDYAAACSICRRPIQELITIRPKPVNKVIEKLLKIFFLKTYQERQKKDNTKKDLFLYDESSGVEIPIFVCSLGLPLLEVPLHIFEPRYKLLVRRCQESRSKMFGICMYDEEKDFLDYGTMLEIRNSQLLKDGRLLLETTGGRRFRVIERGRVDGYHTAKVQWLHDEHVKAEDLESIAAACKSSYNDCKAWMDNLSYVIKYRMQSEFGGMPPFDESELQAEHGPKWVWWMIRLLTQGNREAALKALKSTSTTERLKHINDGLEHLKTVLRVHP